MRSGLLTRSILVVGALLATACGGTDGEGSTTTQAPTVTTTTGGASTTAALGATTTLPRIPLPSADPAAVSRGERGVLTLADLGGSWVEFEAGGGVFRDVNPTSRLGCALQPSGALAPSTLGALVDGPILQKGTTKRYATSATFTLADEPAAQAAVNAFRSPAWSACLVARKTGDAKAQPGDAVDPQWRAEPIDDTGRGQGGFEGVVRLQFQAAVDGKLTDANGYETDLFYRVGRTVLLVAAEGQNDLADPPGIEATINAELSAAIEKALARLA